MRILGLATYPIEAAATRYRLAQFIDPLAKKGISLEISPFLDREQFALLYQNKSLPKKIAVIVRSLGKRFIEISKIRRYDLILVQREAMFFGPAFFEWFFQRFSNLPLILDLDDATYIRYISPTYGKIGSYFKFFGKTDNLIKRADAVVCGNRFIAEYVAEKGTKSVIIPTVVDTEKFCPIEKNNRVPILGWIGTHSTFPLLESIFPILQKLAKKYEFVLKIVGAGRETIELEGVRVENLDWNLERETADFQSLDIGLYPITTSDSASADWLLGKSGFKAIQYMAVGIPFVVTPIGVCAEIGEAGKTHFDADNREDWYNALDTLIADVELRKTMGENARKFSLQNYTLEAQTEKFLKLFRETGNFEA